MAAALAAAIVAELAVLMLAPADPGPDPSPVEATSYFNAAQIDEARDYRDGQRNLGLAGLGIEVGALGLLALGRPRRIRGLLKRAGARPLIGAAA
ncbi:MAG: hypothetical protein H0V25_00325, partial [Solirubrobacterales bacterium]|nr:hypothetical protein [Solirubrobacterales bacterium]